MEDCSSTHSILENDYLIIYRIDLHHKKDRYFTIGKNKCQKFAFLELKREIKVNKVNKVSQVSLELGKFKSEQMNEDEVSFFLTDIQENKLSSLLYDHKGAFETEKEQLREIIGYEVNITLKIERPNPPLLRTSAYPEIPKSREALDLQIKGLLYLGAIRNAGHNEEVEINTPVIVE
ncbi:hypothetical protein O181_062996 [Austropuccinia psidii MF-1]|uniref:Uncharacterized protein n=1 Tax=Austropuccinia psidii MF-1 TaxID=1389203 RepID=A0A9Q3EQV5_9BASI|nr:hypothetical protein [Austropuccinia psidii MF-1]